MSEWQPVETAPKDVMIIGGFFSDREGDTDSVTICWWQQEFDAFISSCRQMRLAAGLSFDGGANTKLHSPVIEKITHWMPYQAPE